MHARLPSNQTDMAVIVGNQREQRQQKREEKPSLQTKYIL